MPVDLAELFVTALFVYAGIGLVFALAFVAVGIAKVDPVAQGASFGLRLLLFPGSAAFWPLLLTRWMRGRTAPAERTPHKLRAADAGAPAGRRRMIAPLRKRHRLMTLALAVVLPAPVALALLGRPEMPRAQSGWEVLPDLTKVEGRQTFVLLDEPLRLEGELRQDDERIGGGPSLRLRPLEAPTAPDLLFYWSEQESQGGALPVDARLLGGLRQLSEPLSLPSAAGGYLVLYSLAHAEVLWSNALFE